MDANISIKGLDKLQAALEQADVKATDYSPLESTIKAIFLDDLRERFEGSPSVESGGTVPGGAYWKPLSPVSLKRRPKGKILIDSHTLERSLTVEGDGNNIFEINGTEIVFGSNVPYAARQDRDRPFLFWHPLLISKLTAAISSWIVEELKVKQ